MISRKTAEKLLNIDEIKHYYEVTNTERTLKIADYFIKELDFKTENKIVRSIQTKNTALLENTIKDVQKIGADRLKRDQTL